MVGADQRRAEPGPPHVLQAAQQFEAADGVAEMIIGQHRIDLAAACDLLRLAGISRLGDLDAPGAEQRVHAVEDRGVVVHTQDPQAAQADRLRRHRGRFARR